MKRMTSRVTTLLGFGRATDDCQSKSSASGNGTNSKERAGVTMRRSQGKDEIKDSVRKGPFVPSNKYFFHPLIKKGFVLIYRLKIIPVKIKIGVFGRY